MALLDIELVHLVLPAWWFYSSYTERICDYLLGVYMLLIQIQKFEVSEYYLHSQLVYTVFVTIRVVRDLWRR